MLPDAPRYRGEVSARNAGASGCAARAPAPTGSAQHVTVGRNDEGVARVARPELAGGARALPGQRPRGQLVRIWMASPIRLVLKTTKSTAITTALFPTSQSFVRSRVGARRTLAMRSAATGAITVGAVMAVEIATVPAVGAVLSPAEAIVAPPRHQGSPHAGLDESQGLGLAVGHLVERDVHAERPVHHGGCRGEGQPAPSAAIRTASPLSG